MLWVLIRSASMSTHNICFCAEIRKIFTGYPPLSRSVAYHRKSYVISHKVLSKIVADDSLNFYIFWGENKTAFHANCLLGRQKFT